MPWTAPLESVSLSGVALAGARSSTLACTLPPAWRSAPAVCVEGTLSASLRRKLLKSLLCARTVCEASAGGIALAASSAGTSSTAPDFRRLILPWMKASGLLLSSATSIWSSDTLAGLFCAAILPAVSPAFTVTCLSLDGMLPTAGALAAGAVVVVEGRVAGAAGGVAGDAIPLENGTTLCAAGRGSTGAVGATVSPALAERSPGGSNSIV